MIVCVFGGADVSRSSQSNDSRKGNNQTIVKRIAEIFSALCTIVAKTI